MIFQIFFFGHEPFSLCCFVASQPLNSYLMFSSCGKSKAKCVENCTEGWSEGDPLGSPPTCQGKHGKLLQLCRFLLCFPTSEMRQYLGDDLYVCRPSAGSCFLNMLSCWSKHMNVGYWKSIITYLRARNARVDEISTSNHTGLELVLQTVLTWRGKAQWERGSY